MSFEPLLLAGLQNGLGQVSGWDASLLPSGITFSQGYHFNAISKSVQEVADEIEGCLYNTGAFSDLHVSYPEGFWAKPAGLVETYWQVDGRTATAFGHAQDLQDLIRGTIQTCVVSASIKDELPLAVVSYPTTDYQGNVVDRGTGAVPAAPSSNSPFGQTGILNALGLGGGGNTGLVIGIFALVVAVAVIKK